jgi:2-haloacid dehalogenase
VVYYDRKQSAIVLRFNQYQLLTFNCYGTLIDWEVEILAALKPVLAEHRVELTDEEILKLYAEFESQAEVGRYIKYREVLRRVMREFGRRFDFVPSEKELIALEKSLPDWKPFGDTVAALRALKSLPLPNEFGSATHHGNDKSTHSRTVGDPTKYRLGIISNVDDDLLAQSAKQLEVNFDLVITAEQVGAYKPSLENFNAAIKRSGVPKDRILHIAQSIYHDIVPAKQLGLATVWVNRRHGQRGSGATLPAHAKPDVEVPDLRALVSMMGL